MLFFAVFCAERYQREGQQEIGIKLEIFCCTESVRCGLEFIPVTGATKNNSARESQCPTTPTQIHHAPSSISQPTIIHLFTFTQKPQHIYIYTATQYRCQQALLLARRLVTTTMAVLVCVSLFFPPAAARKHHNHPISCHNEISSQTIPLCTFCARACIYLYIVKEARAVPSFCPRLLHNISHHAATDTLTHTTDTKTHQPSTNTGHQAPASRSSYRAAITHITTPLLSFSPRSPPYLST